MVIQLLDRGLHQTSFERAIPSRSFDPAASDLRSGVHYRRLQANDLAAVMKSVGPTVDDLYPAGAHKLFHRLEDVLEGAALCTVAVRRGRPGDELVVGIAVESPKHDDRVKLSTLWVAPTFRRLGIARELVQSCVERWSRNGITAHLTVRQQCSASVVALLEPFGFSQIAIEPNRYGIGAHEVILRRRAAEVASGSVDNR